MALGRGLAGIQYMGLPGISQSCKRAVQRLLLSGEQITQATVLTAGQTHALLLQIEPAEAIAVKTGFSSGYSGEGPRTLSEVLRLLQSFGVALEEVEVSDALIRRIEQSALTQSDLDGIERARPVRPLRWHKYISADQGYEIVQPETVVSLPEVMPWALLDKRLALIALGFEANPDHALLLGFRKLEDIVRARLGQEVPEGRVMATAFAGDRSKLTWDKLPGGGAYGAFRNPRAHKLTQSPPGLALQEFLLLNLLYTLERTAIDRPEEEAEQDAQASRK